MVSKVGINCHSVSVREMLKEVSIDRPEPGSPAFPTLLTIGFWPQSEEVGALEQRQESGILRTPAEVKPEELLTFLARQVH